MLNINCQTKYAIRGGVGGCRTARGESISQSV